MDTTSRNEAVIRRHYAEVVNAGRLELVADFVSPDYVGSQGDTGVDGFRRVIEALRTGLPDIRVTIEDVVAQGDRVVARTSVVGTNTGPMRGVAPSGRRVTNTGIAIFQLRDGKIVRIWMETDRLGFLQQIGAVPENVVGPVKPL
jgi:steroid delta-isomerase-like uncharacterized protein